jgi:acetyl-CoA C-acetyltransferase
VEDDRERMARAMDNEVVIVDAVRSAIGRRNGSLSRIHAIDLLGAVFRQLIGRVDIDPATVGQVVGGCVGQVGMQSMNVTRNAWLGAGLPLEVPATTVDAQCGSSQQAVNLAYSLVASGVVDVAIGCGIELMSRVPMGSTVPRDPDVGKAINRRYWEHHEFVSQFEAAERLAEKWGISRGDCDEFGKLSQDRAATAWTSGRFAAEVVSIEVPVPEGGGASQPFAADEALRSTTMDGLASLRPSGRESGVHTAGTSSQIADGAAAVLLMKRQRAVELGMTPIATIVDACLVGTDPTLMLEGPSPATRRLLADNGLSPDELDFVEVNEAFAAVVLAWERDLKVDMARVNPNGGAIALGHPLGATGAILITKAVHALAASGGEHALVTMCCAGGLGTGTLLRRG